MADVEAANTAIGNEPLLAPLPRSISEQSTSSDAQEERDANQIKDVASGREYYFWFLSPVLLVTTLCLGQTVVPIVRLQLEFFNNDESRMSWISGSFEASGALLAMIWSPMVGRLADRIGRKPVLCASIVFNAIPLIPLAFNMSLWWYYVLHAIHGPNSSTFGLAFAYVSDIVPVARRSAFMGLVMAHFGAGFLLGPWLSTTLGDWNFPVALILSAAILVFAIVFLPESLSLANRQANREHHRTMRATRTASQKIMDLRPIRIALRNKMVRFIVATIFFCQFAELGLVKVLQMYLTVHLGFGDEDRRNFMTILGFSMIISQTLGVFLLLRFFHEKNILVLGNVVVAGHILAYSFVTTKWQVYVIGVLASLGFTVFPITSSMVSRYIAPRDQGVIQGAIGGIKAFCSGAGPFLFSLLYSGTCCGKLLGIHTPEIFFWVGTAIASAGVVTACLVPKLTGTVFVVTEKPLPDVASDSSDDGDGDGDPGDRHYDHVKERFVAEWQQLGPDGTPETPLHSEPISLAHEQHHRSDSGAARPS